MNVYRLIVGGEEETWRATSMQEAVTAAEKKYLTERADDLEDAFDKAEELEEFHSDLLESCCFLGRLEN